MKIPTRILKPLVILILAYATFYGLHAWRNSYICLHKTTRAYPYPGSSYHAELYLELCDDFGVSVITSLRLVRPGLFGTKFGSKKDLFVFDDADIPAEPSMRWIKPDVLEVRMNLKKRRTLDPLIEETDGIKIIYIWKDTINSPPLRAPKSSL